MAARWEALSAQSERSGREWPYVALMAAESLLRLGRWTECHALLDEVLETRTQPVIECRVLTMRGRLHLLEGRTDLAEQPIQRALELAQEARSHEWAWPTVRYAHLRAVELDLAHRRPEDAAERVALFLEDEALYAGAPLERLELLLSRAAAEESRELDAPGVPSGAAETARSAAAELRALTPSAERDRLLAHAELTCARLELAENRLEAAESHLAAARKLLDSGDPAGVASQLEQCTTLEARLALARGAEVEVLRRARQVLEASFSGRVARLERLPQRPDGTGLLQFFETRSPLSELIRLDVAIEGDRAGAIRGLERIVALQALGTLSRRLNADVPTLDEIRAAARLKPDSGLLVYLPVAPRSLVIAIDGSTVRCEELAGFNALSRARELHVGLLLAPLPDDPAARESALTDERSAARELSKLLLPARVAERVRTWRALTVSGLDVLGPVPLGWLPIGDELHLGRRMAWDVLPSIPFGVAREKALESGRVTPQAEFLLVGDITPGDALPGDDSDMLPLPLPTSTSSSLARPYSTAHVLAGEAATPAQVLEDATRHVVVQLLVHAIEDPDRPRASGLVLSPTADGNGVLWGDDIAFSRSEESATRLVVLASCRSGQGPLRRGDAGSADLAGAWLAAGASAALVSHSDLTWGPTVELSALFHRHLRESGLSPAESLRLALSEIDAEDPRELPFRFGLLEVVGLGQRPVFDVGPLGEDSWGHAPLLAAGLAAILLTGWWAARRRARRAVRNEA